MALKNRRNMSHAENAKDYSEGYLDGVRDAIEDSEIHAYYAGVGYGKHRSGNTNLGFNTRDERESFHAGINNNDKHFNSYQYKTPGFFARLFKRFSESERIKRREKRRKKAFSDRLNKKRARRKMERNRQSPLFTKKRSKRSSSKGKSKKK